MRIIRLAKLLCWNKKSGNLLLRTRSKEREIMTRRLLGRKDVEFEFSIKIEATTKRISRRRRSEKDDSDTTTVEMTNEIKKRIEIKRRRTKRIIKKSKTRRMIKKTSEHKTSLFRIRSERSSFGQIVRK